jgi:ankyrin repeat protein
MPALWIELLLNYGADPNSKSYDGKSALHIACGYSSLSSIKMLLERGADRCYIHFGDKAIDAIPRNQQLTELEKKQAADLLDPDKKKKLA